MEILLGAVEHVVGSRRAQQLCRARVADDVHEPDVVFETNAIEHLPDVGGGCGMHDGFMAFPAHGLDHGQNGERIDAGCGPIAGGYALGKEQTVSGLQDAEETIGSVSEGDFASDQFFRVSSRTHDRSSSFVAEENRAIPSRRYRGESGFRNLTSKNGVVRSSVGDER